MSESNISQEDAQASLLQVHDVMNQTNRAITSSYANPALILWGALWVIAFTASHFYLAYAFHIFMAMAAVGGVGTALIFRVFHSKAPVKEASSRRMGCASAFFGFYYVSTSPSGFFY